MLFIYVDIDNFEEVGMSSSVHREEETAEGNAHVLPSPAKKVNFMPNHSL